MMNELIELHILHKFGCDKCYSKTQELLQVLQNDGLFAILTTLDDTKTPEDIPLIRNVRSVIMYLNEGVFQYKIYDGVNETIVNHARIIPATFKESSDFYNTIFEKYIKIYAEINAQILNYINDVISIDYDYFYQKPYEITYILNLDESLSDERINNIYNNIYNATKDVDTSLSEGYNIIVRTQSKEECSACAKNKTK